jgi:hypothetical protein
LEAVVVVAEDVGEHVLLFGLDDGVPPAQDESGPETLE